MRKLYTCLFCCLIILNANISVKASNVDYVDAIDSSELESFLLSNDQGKLDLKNFLRAEIPNFDELSASEKALVEYALLLRIMDYENTEGLDDKQEKFGEEIESATGKFFAVYLRMRNRNNLENREDRANIIQQESFSDGFETPIGSDPEAGNDFESPEPISSELDSESESIEAPLRPSHGNDATGGEDNRASVGIE